MYVKSDISTAGIYVWVKHFPKSVINYRVIFLTGPALKLPSVGDGKIPAKKEEV